MEIKNLLVALGIYAGASIGLVTVAQAQTGPIITNIQPTAAAVGATITLSGTGFAPLPAQNAVYFGAVAGQVLTASATVLTVRVPAGASSGVPLTITNRASLLTGSSLVAPVPRFRVLFASGPLASGSYRRSDVPVGFTVEEIATGDFNRDGRPDLVVSARNLGGVSGLAVALNLGNGTFGTPFPVDANIQPYGLAVGDLNGDGNLDIAASNIISRDMSVILGDGQGGFTTPTNTDLSSSGSIRVAIGDADGDGRPDIFTIDQNQVSILYSLGNGQFNLPQPVTSLSAPVTSAWFDLADFNSDGGLDVVFPAVVGGQAGFSVLLAPAAVNQPYTLEFASGNPQFLLETVRATDFNNDGRPDVVATNSNGVQIWLRNATGTGFNAPVNNNTFPPFRLDLGTTDLNGDGNVDVFSTASNGPLLLQTGTGSAALNVNSPTYTAPLLNNPNSSRRVASADFNGDGRPDLVTANDFNASVSVFFNIGSAVAGAPTLDPIADQLAAQVPTTLTVPLSGISGGGGSGQFVTVAASSSDPAQVATPVVSYTSPSAVGSLTLAVNGPATITVMVSNGQATNGSVSRSFRVVRSLASAASQGPFKLALYPNPSVGGRCWLQLPNGKPAILRLTDPAGRLVLTQTLPGSNAPIEVQLPAGLAQGTYLASLNSGADVYRQRLVVLP